MTYYFQLDVIKLTKFEQSMLGVLGNICLLAGVVLYSKFFKRKEVRSMLLYAIIMNTLGCFMNLIQALRWNLAWGINDLGFVIFTSSITDTLTLAFS